MSDLLTIGEPEELNFEQVAHMATCKHCKTTKRLSEFYAKSKSKCKECAKATAKRYRGKYTEKVRKYARDKYHNNEDVKEATKKRARAYWHANKKHLLELQKKRRSKKPVNPNE